jgi:L-methionine (R)-S-oxide reductase
MVHADSASFGLAPTKQAVYDQILEQAALLFDGQRNWVCTSSEPTAAG